MTTALVLLAAACGFTAAAAGSTRADGLLDEPPRWALVATVFVGVAAAASMTTRATGWAAADLGWRVVVAVIAAIAGAYASPVLLALVCAALAAAAGGGAAVAVAAAAGTQVATVATRGRSPLLGAAAGAAAISAALRLERPEDPVLVAALGSAAVAVIVIGGAVRMPRRRAVLGVLATGVVAVAAVAALGAFSALSARPRLEEGTRLANTALADARQGDVGAARHGLEQAAAALRSGGATLDPWWARPARALPVVGANLDVAVTMADVGGELAVLGAGTLAAADLDLAIVDGKVPIDELIALRAPLRRSLDALREAEAALGHPSTWLVPPLSSRRDQLGDRVTTARRDAEVASLAAGRLPEMFGGSETRRYLLASLNPAELRGSGGIAGSVAVVTAEGGRLRLEPVGRPDNLNRDGAVGRELRGPADYVARYGRFEPQTFWQNISMSPDFPTVGEVLADQYAQTGRTPVDGVIAVDPTALAALLVVVGPVDVPGMPEPLTADNAERELLHEQYVRFPTTGDDTERIDFLGNATGQVWDRLTNAALPAPSRLADALGPAVAGRHLQITSFHAEDQVLLDRVGITGRVTPVAGDFLGVVTQNAGANKIDWFLDRRYHYDVRLDPATGRTEATLDIELENTSPASGLPAYVIGPFLPMSRPTEPGDNRLFLSIYTPWEMTGATLGGDPLLLESAEELDRRVYSALLDIPAGTTAEIRVILQGRYAGAPGYQLDVLRQPTVRPDEMTMSVTLEGGARVTETTGGLEPSGPSATAAFPIDQARRLQLAYEG